LGISDQEFVATDFQLRIVQEQRDDLNVGPASLEGKDGSCSRELDDSSIGLTYLVQVVVEGLLMLLGCLDPDEDVFPAYQRRVLTQVVFQIAQ
jgi:hypothetical protein